MYSKVPLQIQNANQELFVEYEERYMFAKMYMKAFETELINTACFAEKLQLSVGYVGDVMFLWKRSTPQDVLSHYRLS